ncbi:helix-turn-helix domain-containing protein [Micromonospora sp. ATA51]|nr:helix-turn-helix domain-containing protein [Micromonospora sp. ATA51]
MRRYEAPAGWTVQAYKFALDPADEQSLRRHAGAARFVFNHMLGRLAAVNAQRLAEASYGVAEADLTPWQGWSLPDLRRTWNHIKQWVAPWWRECSKEAFNTGQAAPEFRDWFLATVAEHTVVRAEQAAVATFELVPDRDMAGARGVAIAALETLLAGSPAAGPVVAG